jgi:hypothetical protein
LGQRGKPDRIGIAAAVLLLIVARGILLRPLTTAALLIA